MASTKVVHGIILVERTCSQCPLTFWTPKSSKTKTCGEFCLQKASGARHQYKGKAKRKKFTDKIKKEDYAK